MLQQFIMWPCPLHLPQGNLKKVQRLDCSNNLLARIPPSMGHLKFLKEFGLRYNSLDDRYVFVCMYLYCLCLGQCLCDEPLTQPTLL